MQHPAVLRTLALLFASLIATAAAPPATARQQQQQQPPQPQQQQPPPPEEAEEVARVTTELVQTDVTVIDRAGNFVDGLKAEQFELKVDGHPRPVLFFERVAAGGRDESAQLAAARGTRRAGGASAAGAVPLDRGRIILVFIDDIHLSPASFTQTRKLLSRFVNEELRQNDRMLIATATGQAGFLQQLTDERAVLSAAISRLAPRAQPAQDNESPRMSVVQALAIQANDRLLFETFVDLTQRENPAFSGPAARRMAEQRVEARASSLAAQAGNAATRTLESLRGLVRQSAKLPGRKVLYFISDGFALDPRGDTQLDRLRRVADASLRAGVVIYTVDARGLAAHIPESTTAAEGGVFDPSGRIASSNYREASETQSPLHTLAGETGGRAILNTNALGAAIGRTLKETSVYYLLAWRPEAEDVRGTRFRRVEVAVRDRPELSILAQRGFFASPPEERVGSGERRDQKGGAAVARETAAREGTRELLDALRAPLPRAGVPTALTLNFAKGQDGQAVLTATVRVEFGAGPAAGETSARTELLVAFYDDAGKAVGTFHREVGLTPQTAGAPPRSRAFTINFQSQVRPGLYQVRAASRDLGSRRTGSDAQWIEIPNVARGNFALSSIFLGDPPPASAAAAADGGPQIVLSPDRRFRRETRLRFIVHVYNAAAGGGGAPDVALQLQAFRDDQPVVTAPLKKISTEGLTDFSAIPYAAEISLADLPPGRYTMQLTAIDRLAKASATQRVKFVIE